MQCTEECGRKADVYCQHESLYYCNDCSEARHVKKPFEHHDVLPICDMCDASPAAYRCVLCGPVNLCVQCDESEHSKPARAQKRHDRCPVLLRTFACRMISERVVTMVKKTDTELFVNMKSKIRSILEMANKAGTEHEADHAKLVAKNLMKKYQIELGQVMMKPSSLDDFELFEAVYKVEINSNDWDESDSRKIRWFSRLAIRVVAFFPDLVDRYADRESTRKVYAFYGHEPSAWEAASLYTELFGIICYHRNAYAKRSIAACKKADDFACGMCDGLSLDSVDTGTEEVIEESLALVRTRGQQMLKGMFYRLNLSCGGENKTGPHVTDKEAYRAGKKKGAEIDVSSLGKLKIEDAYC